MKTMVKDLSREEMMNVNGGMDYIVIDGGTSNGLILLGQGLYNAFAHAYNYVTGTKGKEKHVKSNG